MIIVDSLSRHINRKFKSIQGLPLKFAAPWLLAKNWQERDRLVQQPHSIKGQLVVNLTSYPPRFPTLHMTLQSLLLQTVKADRVVLWLYAKDSQKLPESVTKLQQEGLEIQLVEQDIKSYKKLIPALIRWPDAFHVTADDDIYYRDNWLAELVAGYAGDNRQVVCLRGHFITTDNEGQVNPYRDWQAKTEHQGPNNRIFFTSGAGALFPPGALHKDITDQDKFMRLSPHGDDIWLYWMTVLNGSTIRRTGKNRKLIVWKHSKAVSLWQFNKQVCGGNDEQIQNMIKAYGLPPLP
ncbi:hypothetical protein [Pseudoalteromonas mariniglutinosa]|uniref:hypothetical protein n=1 Tax=Pseudoalteromonas mariniglutinosa TaxID=206042 RepID=UPI00384C2A00